MTASARAFESQIAATLSPRRNRSIASVPVAKTARASIAAPNSTGPRLPPGGRPITSGCDVMAGQEIAIVRAGQDAPRSLPQQHLRLARDLGVDLDMAGEGVEELGELQRLGQEGADAVLAQEAALE